MSNNGNPRIGPPEVGSGGWPVAASSTGDESAVGGSRSSLGVARADGALTRLLKLKPVVTDRPVTNRVKSYLSEVVDTYAFGFDAACIALCRATCEQVLKKALVESGVYTESQLRREHLTAGRAIKKAKEKGILQMSTDAARRLVKKGDRIMHQSVIDERIIEQQALDSISELSEVLIEVLR